MDLCSQTVLWKAVFKQLQSESHILKAQLSHRLAPLQKNKIKAQLGNYTQTGCGVKILLHYKLPYKISAYVPAGIIQNVKMRYRKKLLCHFKDYVDDECCSVSELAKKVIVLDAILWLKCARDMVKSMTYERCFCLV